jgi:GTPase SAR1 family protein
MIATARADQDSGLDNAGKTTIVKKIMGEDVNSVSPTLGFIIKTIDYEGQVLRNLQSALTAKPNLKIQTQHM